ncbi:hypothetical protein EI77_03153 [Prosthecobacter fusiformis]|uniref:ATP-grasp domain-containing protein n=1 Tax=Prosthecobacter fusiformis TaxID=48464 RepID=A0A4R7RT92_9BACT|nr:hypothetical protein [Prosthecobacter fusiformis]TDU68036.1 hypothetical protein EI77_03153 [Prosthecobacter fusiformis]
MISSKNPPAAPQVVQTHGHTPRLWRDRSIIFFANVLAGFFENEELAALLKKEISGADSYGGRLLPIMGLLFAGGKNLLVLEREPDAALTAYFKDDLGLNLPEISLLTYPEYLELGTALRGGDSVPLPFPQQLNDWQNHPADTLDGYVTDEIIATLARQLGKRTLSTSQGSKQGNNKLLLHQHLEKSGLPVFKTRLATGPDDVQRCLDELAALGYESAVVKSQIGASGIGLMKLCTKGSGEAVPELFFYEGPCMVQGWIRPGMNDITHVFSPSVQMFLDHESVYLYDLTEQILSQDSVHQGNESPPPYLADFPGLKEELFRQASTAGTWLHEQGYRGTASVDYLVAALETAGAFRAYSCEINARVTGATYPSVLARHYFPAGAWLMRNLKLSLPLAGSTILKLLEDHRHLFHPDRAGGILPINFNLTPDGLVEKGQFLCLGESTAECHAMLQRAEEDLPLDWEYVRD